MRSFAVLASAMLMAGPVLAQTGAAPAVSDVPAFKPQRLILADIPRAAGPARTLFNGRDLDDWEAWLGYADPALTYRAGGATPLGSDPAAPRMFSVVREDGAPALRVDGRIWGGLVHKADLRDYHLSLEFKWGERQFAPRLNLPRNNGLLFHSHGAPGAMFGTWMEAVEFEIMRGSTGMVLPVSRTLQVTVPVAEDKTILSPYRRFMVGGREVDVGSRGPWNAENASDAERPVGKWNRLDLYTLGDRAVFVVNGTPVMEVKGIARIDAAGKRAPLTHGRIQLQSEGAETFFRKIRVEPIRSLPRVVIAK